MKLWAISDLHIAYEANRDALLNLTPHLDDWLIIAGDVGESEDHLRFCLRELSQRFRQLVWVPGNHELYTTRSDPCQLRGEKRYLHMVNICREYGALTPEDPYATFTGRETPTVIAPVFILYDYTFAPEGMTPTEVKKWSREHKLVSTDEYLLHPDPYPSRSSWCLARLSYSRARLAEIPKNTRIILVNHYPLRQDLVRLFRIPRYSPWCGTRATEHWHTEYPIDVVVSGHLHVRATDWRDGVRFEEVSLGYPRHWRVEKGMDCYLREILPGPAEVMSGNAGPFWHR